MQFSVLAVRYGLDLSLKNMGMNVLKFYLLSIVLVADFGRLTIVKHKWRSILSRDRE